MTKIMTNFMTNERKKTQVDDRLFSGKSGKSLDLWAFRRVMKLDEI